MSTMERRGVSPLRAVRESKGLTLRQASTRANLSKSHLSRVERGETDLSVAALKRLAAALRVEPAWLLEHCGKDPA